MTMTVSQPVPTPASTTMSPTVTPTPAATVLTFPAAVFVEVARNVTGSASTDSLRPILGGVELTVADGVVTFVATDSYQLAKIEVAAASVSGPDIALSYRQPVGERRSVLLDAKDLVAACKLVPKKRDVHLYAARVTVPPAGYVAEVAFVAMSEIEDGRANAALPTLTYPVRLVEGDFPNWVQLIPSDGTYAEANPNGVALAGGMFTLLGKIKAANGVDGQPHWRIRGIDALKPVRFDATNAGYEMMVLVMPVRTA